MRRIVRYQDQPYLFMANQQIVEGYRPLTFAQQSKAGAFLNRFLTKPSCMHALRAVLVEEGDSLGVSKMSDRQVIDRLAAILYKRRIRVLAPLKPEIVSCPMVLSKAIDLPTMKKSSEIEKPVKKDNDDALIAQAETLKAASLSGMPFCNQ